MGTHALAVEFSANGKLGKFKMSTTFASKCSCSDDCPFKNSGCYAESGPTNIQWNRLNCDGTDVQTAQDEAAAINSLSGQRPLRIHTAGDCKTDEAAQIVSAAAERYTSKRGHPAFGYTRAWKQVDRKSWGKVSILASCFSAAEVQLARAKGYATSIVLPFLKFNTFKTFQYQGVKVVPCPHQTGKVQDCDQCRMCMKDGKLYNAGITIGFAVHGPTIQAARVFGMDRLPKVGGE